MILFQQGTKCNDVKILTQVQPKRQTQHIIPKCSQNPGQQHIPPSNDKWPSCGADPSQSASRCVPTIFKIYPRAVITDRKFNQGPSRALRLWRNSATSTFTLELIARATYIWSVYRVAIEFVCLVWNRSLGGWLSSMLGFWKWSVDINVCVTIWWTFRTSHFFIFWNMCPIQPTRYKDFLNYLHPQDCSLTFCSPY